MTYKKYLFTSIILVCISLSIFASVIIIIDPFYQYHQPLNGLSYRPNMNLHSYTNPGVAKNFDYDTVVLGSSMTRTVSSTYAQDRLGWNLVKLSIPEARGRDIREMFELVRDDVQNIVIGIDTFAYNVDADMEANKKPNYLWNKNVFDDVSYILNKNVFIDQIANILLDTWKGLPSFSRDQYQNWEEVLTIKEGDLLYWAKNNQTSEDFLESTYDYNVIQENLRKNLLSVIENHPDKNFVIYFPPYSLFYWQNIMINQGLDAEFDEMEYIIENLLNYNNVSIYFPVDNLNIILDYEHYLDYMHYDTFLSNKVLDEFTSNEKKLTKENFESRISNFRNIIETFPYETFINDNLKMVEAAEE